MLDSAQIHVLCNPPDPQAFVALNSADAWGVAVLHHPVVGQTLFQTDLQKGWPTLMDTLRLKQTWAATPSLS